MKFEQYQHRLREMKNKKNTLSKREYDDYFKLSKKELERLTISGIAMDKNKNKLLLSKDNKTANSVLLYSDPKNNFYYLNSGNNIENTIKTFFDNNKKYEIIDKNLFIYNEKNLSITDYSQLDQIYNKESKNISFDTPIDRDRKYRLTNLKEVDSLAKEKLALNLGLSSNSFKNDIVVSSVENLKENKSLLTIENEKTNKQEYLVSDFKENFINNIQEKLKVNTSVKLGFEEVKNASAQIAMGFLEFYGAEFDESTLERDPKIILEEKGYVISKIDKQGNRNDLSKQSSLDQAINEAKKYRKLEKDLYIELEQNKINRSDKND